MTSYPFIKDLFTNVLQKSKAIEGRFFICPKSGNEINSDDLGQVLTDVTTQLTTKKYPLVLMMPPRSKGVIHYNQAEFKRYFISLFWLKTTYYDSNNQISNLNPNTQTSMHTVPQDWHDMERCAQSFLRVIDKLQRNGSNGLLNMFRLPVLEKIFAPVSLIGVDRASGVRSDFAVDLLSGCELEDYLTEDISLIEIPDADSHPEHDL